MPYSYFEILCVYMCKVDWLEFSNYTFTFNYTHTHTQYPAHTSILIKHFLCTYYCIYMCIEFTCILHTLTLKFKTDISISVPSVLSLYVLYTERPYRATGYKYMKYK